MPGSRREGSGRAGETTRRCAVTGAVQSPEGMLRFVVGPEGDAVPDVEGRLPGRGIWLSASRDVVNTAVAKKAFAKAAREKVTADPDLADRVEALLVRSCLALLGLARRAGQVAAGADQVTAELAAGRVALLLQASDSSPSGRGKVRGKGPDVPVTELFTSAELGAALGRDAAVHVTVAPGRLADRLAKEAGRLAGFRRAASDTAVEPPRQRAK